MNPEPAWSPGTGPQGGYGAAVAETHVSILVFAGDRAYKLKKAVRNPFLDFSSPELRRQACLREVQLNRRLSPDVYLGVADVLGPDGRPCDHLMVMRRMPAERRLSRLVGDGEQGCLEQVAALVARFHADAAAGPHISAEGSPKAVAARWEANIAELEGCAGELPDPLLPEEVAGRARTWLARNESLLARRVTEGWIRDGHGDLLADDIFCLEDGPRILDCLEFDDRLRYVDVIDDAAFLAMDLERIGGAAAGRAFLDAYRETGGQDHPETLIHHYIAYRAHLRAKIACLRHGQGDPDARGEAAALLAIALHHLDLAE